MVSVGIVGWRGMVGSVLMDRMRSEDDFLAYWIDAASTLRMAPDSTIVLDPVNRSVIEDALAAGSATSSAATAPSA
jgi:aspartate-semialdehyde dehydrogenase